MTTDPHVGRTIAGYRLVELIGRGGMGVVYRAEQLSLGRDVAFKLLREDLAHDQAFRGRFLRESRLGGQVLHPNLVPIYDAGEADGNQASTASTLPAPSTPTTSFAQGTSTDELVTTEPEETLPSLVEPTTTTLPQPPTSLRLPFTLKGRGEMQLPPFTAAGSWRLAWSYDCRKAEYFSSFILRVDPGVDSVYKSGTSQSGVEAYEAGTHALNVQTDDACRWSLRATGPPGARNLRVPFTLSGSRSATTAPFTVRGGWDIAWSYRCSGDALFGGFEVNVHPDRPYAIMDHDGGGSGVEHLDSGGTYFLQVAPEDGCSWMVKVTG